MPPTRKRWLFRIGAILLLLPIAAVAGLRISVWLYQRSAEKMFNRVFALRVNASTFDDAEALWKLYGSLPGQEDQKCDSNSCTFNIGKINFLYDHHLDWKFLRALGIKPVVQGARLEITEGKVTKMQFQLYYRTEVGYWVHFEVKAVGTFTDMDHCHFLALMRHPGYVMSRAHDSGAWFGEEIDAQFSPLAPKDARDRSQSIRWNCLTAVFACEGFSDEMDRGPQSVMPDAVREAEADLHWEIESWKNYPELEKSCAALLLPSK